MPVPMRFIPLLLSAFLWGMPMAADAQDEVFPRLPASAAKSQQEYEKALKDSAFEARAKFIADLKTLLKDSTKSEKLDDAVALRDAIRILESQNRIPLKLPMVFERDDKNMPALILTDRGYRWTDWKQGENARFEFSQTGSSAIIRDSNPNWPENSGAIS